MNNAVENFKTSDLALASYLYSLGGSLVDIDRRNPGRCVFIFELTPQQQEAVAKWQDGTATVNALVFWNSHRTVKRRLYQKEAQRSMED